MWIGADCGEPQESEFKSLSIDIAMGVAAEHGLQLHPGRPDDGPFAYGRADHFTAILDRAGWTDVDFTPHELMLYVGGPGTTPERAVEMSTRIGPMRALLHHAPDDVVQAVNEALVGEFRARWDGTGTPLRAAIAVVSARKR